ncbi:MAG: NAD-dependent epimerase/dehydratase family protein [Candidatus Sungbacteria bacterium]|uniref:NAD-dependent epimerase/dehydratase family protein n=1 Tax=Candidatus Sungiibacteriota bacterium TaxID=2750080 RepID=A0A932YWH2_9BACT|nr:NAD-dependent epimerase/dehydratase family protein [Candidatus Sungbacteria bacterium]
MNIIVVGGRGFIGRPLVEQLRPDHQVEVWDLPEVDIRRPASFSQRLEQSRPDMVVNLAAVLGTMYSKNAYEIFETNALGNLNLVQSCAEHGVRRYVFASSLTVHGENAIGDPRTVNSPFHPKHAYSASKAAAEYCLMQYAKLHAMSIVTVRPVSILGDTYMNHAPVDFVQTLLRDDTIKLFGTGTHEREWLWIDDCAEGFLRAVDFSAAAAPGYHPVFLSGNRISMKDLAEKCISRLGGRMEFVKPTAQAFTLTCDTADSDARLGWRATTGIDAMLDRLIPIQRSKLGLER